MSTKPSPNFAYLAYHDARLVALGTQAEEHFAQDPTITLFKLRQFAEVLAQRAAARFGLLVRGELGQQQLIDRLWEAKAIGATQRSLFHDLRRVGNAAVHEGKGDHGEALHQLRILSKRCTFLSYDSIRELSEVKHLEHLSDSVLEEYEEEASG